MKNENIGITLHQLKIFWTVAQASSFTKASKILGLAQPSLSQQISKLEELGSKLSDYTDNPEIHAELDAEVQRLNQKFANPEQVKKFKILPRDLNVDEGELTPTLKIRRKQINENWANEIEAMYSE